MSKEQENGEITRQTLYMFIAVTFVMGFLSGVVFTSYKASAIRVSGGGSEKASGGTGAHNTDDEAHQKLEAMIRSLEKETEQNPDNVGAWIHLGNQYFDHGDNEKAVMAYEKAVALDPKNPDVLTDLGVVYRRSGNPQKSVESFDRAIAADKSHKTARFNKGVVLMHDLDKKAEAIKVWKELAEVDPLFTTPAGQSLDELLLHYSDHE